MASARFGSSFLDCSSFHRGCSIYLLVNENKVTGIRESLSCQKSSIMGETGEENPSMHGCYSTMDTSGQYGGNYSKSKHKDGERRVRGAFYMVGRMLKALVTLCYPMLSVCLGGRYDEI